ncbi:MAG: hypothetical protein RIS76_2294 [Verrucomicrobiota bacterium]
MRSDINCPLRLWRVFFCLASVGLSFITQAQPKLTVDRLSSAVQLSWPGADTGFQLEASSQFGALAAWQAVTPAPALNAGRFTVTVQPAESVRFFRLRSSAMVLTSLLESSPASGEVGVAVTRETILRFSAPLEAAPSLTPERYYAESGGRRLLSRAELSGDRRTATLFYLENVPADSRVVVHFKGTGLKDNAGAELDVDGDGLAGGDFQLTFTTTGVTGLPTTAVVGRVFASEKNADGSNIPLENVTVTVDGAEESLRATTDATGSFKLQPAPAGRFFVHVDGRTAAGSQWPGGAYYPFVGKAWEAIPGRTNNLAGGTGEVFLPLIESDVLKAVSATEATKISFSPAVLAANPALEGVELNVPANALFSDNGVRGGKVGMAPVPPDRLPEPLPPGLNLPLVITIQTDGGSNFDVPVPVKFPNLPDPVTGIKLLPGDKTALWSFNHDTGRWEIQGSMTISADGNFAVSDAGVGIRQPGWHGNAPGTQGGSGGSGPPNPPRPGNCHPDQELKTWFSVVDLGTDVALLPLNMAPGLGCASGFALSGLRTARDCAFLDLKECPTSGRNNVINGALGCIPVFGALLGTTFSAAQTAQEIDKYYDDCAGKAATLARALSGKSSDSVVPPFLPELEEALDLLLLQDEVNQALADLNALILGSPAWKPVEWRTPGLEYIQLLQAVRAAVSPSSLLAEAISPDERAAILQMARPVGISLTDVEALVNRLANTVPDGLTIPATPANVATFDSATDLLDQVYANGWRNPHDGAIQAISILSRLLEPLPPGSLVLSTGGADAPRVFPTGSHHYLLVNLESGFATRGRTSPQGKLQNLILSPNTRYSISYYTTEASVPGGPLSSEPHIGLAMFTSQTAGNFTRIPYAVLIKDEFPDSDGDGISDNAEVILGTGAYGADSDGDGIKDGQEFLNGTNPLDGTPAATGLIAAADTPGNALDLYAKGNHVFVADEGGGLAVLALNGINNPTLVAQFAVAGDPHAIAGVDNTVALATKTGATLVDISDPAEPKLVATLNLGSGALAVAARGGEVAVALRNGTLVLVDASTGAEQQRLVGLDTELQDLKYSGGRLFALSADELIALERVDGHWGPVGRVAVAGFTAPLEVGRKLVVNDGLAWVGHFNGFAIVDVSNPSSLTVLANQTQAAIHDFALTGSGSLAAVTSFNGEISLAVSLYDVRDPAKAPMLQASFQTAGFERALTVHRGLILVAAGTAGLQIVNFLPPDLGIIPPTVSLTSEYPGQLPRGEFGGLLPVAVTATDDVGLRSIELEVDGVVGNIEGGLPFNAGVALPPKSSGKTSVTLRAKATDLAGNFTWTPPLTVPLVDDATPPQILFFDPGSGSKIVPGAVSEISVVFADPLVSAVSNDTLTLRWSGQDGQLGTADDTPLTGDVSYNPASRTLLLTLPGPMLAGKYIATLASGLADAAGNVRVEPSPWPFETGPLPRVLTLFPPQGLVRVGGTLEELVFTFDQPVPKSVADMYVWNVTHRTFPAGTDGVPGPAMDVAPLQVLRSVDRRTFTLRADGPFAPGLYTVTGSGPNAENTFYEFSFRDVPNEAVETSPGSTGWKYYPGPGGAGTTGEEVIVNLPGQLATVPMGGVESLLAHTDIRFARTIINVLEPIQALAGLEISDTRFGPGVTHVYGPIKFLNQFGNVPTEIGPHTINTYGGGYIRDGELRFSDPKGVLLNHPGSLLVVSNGAAIAESGISWTNSGRIINLGTLRALGAAETIRLEDVRVRNDGRLEVATGRLKMNSLDNEGVLDISAGAQLALPLRARGGVSSRITGLGTIEFGEFNSSTRRVIAFADAEFKGEVDPAVSLKLVAGMLTLWKPLFQQPTATLSLQNGSTLRLLSSARLGTVALLDNCTLSLNADSQIASLSPGSAGTLEAAAVTRITGDATMSGVNVQGQGAVVFEGVTVLSNGTRTANLSIGHATLRNLGTWRHSANGAGPSQFSRRRVDGEDGRGTFENVGRFEQTTDRGLAINVPFRNAGSASLRRGPVVFDARTITATAGAYLPQPGCELVLNNTDLQHHTAGTLDLAAGTLRGTGTIGAVDAATRPRVINRAILRPGNPTGELTIRATGGFEQTATGELAVTLASNDSSRLTLNDTTASLAGTLRVELAEGFSPGAGQTFTVVSCNSRTGEFDNVILPDLGADRRLEVVYRPSSVVVRVVP